MLLLHLKRFKYIESVVRTHTDTHTDTQLTPTDTTLASLMPFAAARESALFSPRSLPRAFCAVLRLTTHALSIEIKRTRATQHNATHNNRAATRS